MFIAYAPRLESENLYAPDPQSEIFRPEAYISSYLINTRFALRFRSANRESLFQAVCQFVAIHQGDAGNAVNASVIASGAQPKGPLIFRKRFAVFLPD